MQKSSVRILWAGILCLLLSALWGPASQALAQQSAEEYFPETGHVVREPFLTFFRKSGALTRFGYPITDDYVDPASGRTIQFFENARLDWYPERAVGSEIALAPLGVMMGKTTAPAPLSTANDPGCQYLNQTGHSVCYLFLEYWTKNGGAAVFGYPIGEYTSENGRFVQYFEYALLEWRPEKPAGQTMQMAPLGRLYYEWAKLDPTRLLPLPTGGNRPKAVTALTAKGSVLNAVVTPTASQTAYVFVKDQLNTPINGAAVTLIIHFPEGDQSFTLPPTNVKGTSFITFPAGKNIKPGTTVSLEFIVAYQGLQTRTRTSYMVWHGKP